MHDYNNHNHNTENEAIEDKIMIFVWGVTLGVVMWRIYELFTLGIWSL